MISENSLHHKKDKQLMRFAEGASTLSCFGFLPGSFLLQISDLPLCTRW